MNKQLEEVNSRIEECKQEMRRFINYKKRWWNPFDYFLYSKEEIQDWVNKYKPILRMNVYVKRKLLTSPNNEGSDE